MQSYVKVLNTIIVIFVEENNLATRFIESSNIPEVYKFNNHGLRRLCHDWLMLELKKSTQEECSIVYSFGF